MKTAGHEHHCSVDCRRIVSGIAFVIGNGLRWRDAPAADGAPRTIYNRFVRWSRMGVFNMSFAALAAKGGKPDQLMIDALPRAQELLLDRGYGADWFRAAFAERGVVACIPLRINPKAPIANHPLLYRQRHRIENMFGKVKDWRSIHTR